MKVHSENVFVIFISNFYCYTVPVTNRPCISHCSNLGTVATGGKQARGANLDREHHFDLLNLSVLELLCVFIVLHR